MALKDEAWRHVAAAYPFRTPLQSRYGDMDSNAHLNNVAIARLFEESRLRFHMDVRHTALDADPRGVMIAHIAIDYVAEGQYPADVLAAVGVARVGTRSYALAMALFQEERTMALAECVMVHRAGMAPALRAALELRAVQR